MRSKFKIEILSPLHIGDGTEMGKYEIYIKDQKVYPVNLSAFRDSLSLELRERLDQEWEDCIKKKELPDLTSFIDDNGIKYDGNRPSMLLMKNLQNEIRPEDKEDNKDNKGKSILNFIKTSDQPFIPGSEIKGAIRTGILYKKLADYPNFLDELVTNLNDIDSTQIKIFLEAYRKEQDKKGDQRNREKVRETKKDWEDEKKNISENIKEEISKLENELFHSYPADLKTSMFKNLIITDSPPIDLSNLLIAKEEIVHDKKPEGMGVDLIKEFLTKFFPNKIEGDLQIKIFNERNKLLFGDKSKTHILDLNLIREACNNFALKKVETELAFFKSVLSKIETDFDELVRSSSSLRKLSKQLGQQRLKEQLITQYIKIIKFYQDHDGLENKIKEEIKNGNKTSIFLRIGAGQGLLSTTIDLLFKDQPVYKKLIANLKENRKHRADEDPYPFSRRVVETDRGFLPPGWIVLREDNS